MIDVVAAVIKKDDKYFIAQRNRNKHFCYHWEFPGGKVDKGETFELALKREILEELSIDIKIKKKISTQNHKDNKINVLIHYFLCELLNGKIQLSEHENMRWSTKKDLFNYKMAPGDSKIIKFLK